MFAKQTCENNIVTPALEHIVKANTLLSGLGVESRGLAAAHGIHNCFTTIAATHNFYHGEKIEIGLQAMMFLTDRPSATIELVFDFCESVGLPISIDDIGMPEQTDEELIMVASRASVAGETIHNEPDEITPRRVMHCIKTADSEGRRRKSIAC